MATAPQSETEMVKEIEVVLSKAFLGYGLISLATEDDMGRGPELQLRVYNTREATPTGLRNLWVSMHEGRHIINRSEVHAVRIALPAKYVTASQMSTDPLEAGDVVWAAAAKGGKDAILGNGQHRHLAVKENLCGKDLELFKG